MEEMCVNYVHYYPRTQLELCKSHVDPDYLQRFFSIINRCLGIFFFFLSRSVTPSERAVPL